MIDWRPISASDLVAVNKLGHVRVLDRWCNNRGTKVLQGGYIGSPSQTPDGYLQISIPVAAGERMTMLVHRMVAEAFFGMCPDGFEVNHKNGIKTDNRVENLEYVTRQENVDHSIASGTFRRTAIGKRAHNAHLTDEQVAEVRRVGRTVRQRDLAKRLGTSQSVISRILCGKTYQGRG